MVIYFLIFLIHSQLFAFNFCFSLCAFAKFGVKKFHFHKFNGFFDIR